MTQTNESIDVARHCIGLNYKKPYVRHGKRFYRPYRNYFTLCGKNELWEALMSEGYAARNEIKDHPGDWVYWLTRAGLDWLGDQLGITIYNESD